MRQEVRNEGGRSCPTRAAMGKRTKSLWKNSIKCSSCGHVFMAQFEQPATDARSAAPSGATGEETSIGGTVGYMAPELEAVDRAIRKGVRETRHSNLEGRSVATTPMPAAHSRMARIPNGPGSDLRR